MTCIMNYGTRQCHLSRVACPRDWPSPVKKTKRTQSNLELYITHTLVNMDCTNAHTSKYLIRAEMYSSSCIVAATLAVDDL
jgi:hypothetical protein